jgi:hypothetical protein
MVIAGLYFGKNQGMLSNAFALTKSFTGLMDIVLKIAFRSQHLIWQEPRHVEQRFLL